MKRFNAKEYKQASKDSEKTHVYHMVFKDIKPFYTGLIGKLDRGRFLELMTEMAEEAFEYAFEYMNFKGTVSYEGPCLLTHEYMYDYAFAGEDPRCHWDNFNNQIGDYLGYAELADAFEESCVCSGIGGNEYAAHILVLNTADARTCIDRYRLEPEENSTECLSIHQLALLAQMQETTVRNYANPKHPDTFETFKGNSGNTLVHVKEAIRWLENKPKYKPTRLPESAEEKAALYKYISY